ncbi:MAG: hypothetical protein HZB62_08155 [Nitrospirae bacterium]|nr:hypothetical protein [Nitrospirota bacterium]
MQKRYSWFLPLIIVAALFLNQGCASTPNQALLNHDRATLGPIKMIRYETPGILKSSGTETGVMALATLAVPGGSALFVVGDAYSKARGADTQYLIPDFGSMVMDRFLECVNEKAPGWPELSAVREPLKEELNENIKTAIIELDVKRLAYGSIDLTRGGIILDRGMDKGVIADGFMAKTVVTMKDPQGDVLWQKSYVYLSKDHDRGMSLDELEANNCDLLKEEMIFAAEMTVQDFVNHLNGSAN